MTGVAFVFPGQGSQHPGMGLALAEAYAESRRVFEEADDALDFHLSRLCFEGSEADLALTENTQPAILTVSIAALRALSVRGIDAASAAGHSLGEYAAHVAAGTISFRDAVRVVRLRGRFMQEAVPVGEGAMAAILGLDPSLVEAICAEAAPGRVVSAANLNGPDQVVIAGHADAVARAAERAKEAGAKRAIPLPVSAPFHCALMEPAARRLAERLRDVPFSAPRFPVVCNVDATPVLTASAARDALVRQVVAPVRWREVVNGMAGSGATTFVEIGPGKVLSSLVRRIVAHAAALSASDPNSVEEVARRLGGAP